MAVHRKVEEKMKTCISQTRMTCMLTSASMKASRDVSHLVKNCGPVKVEENDSRNVGYVSESFQMGTVRSQLTGPPQECAAPLSFSEALFESPGELFSVPSCRSLS